MLWLILGIFILYVVYIIARPIFYLPKVQPQKETVVPPDVFIYSFQAHVHTQFSYDSLGKPEDVHKAAQDLEIDYIIVTDHDNDHIKYFSNEKIVAGIEKKITDKEGKILGDALTVDGIRMVAHPFKKKYAWKLEKSKDLLVEIVDLKDDLLLKKGLLFLYLPAVVFLYIFSSQRALSLLKRVLDLKLFANRYINSGWNNKVFGGLDHHVKIYIREVGIRFLFPHYRHSFQMMRNFLISESSINSKREFIEALKKEQIVVSFDKKPSIVYSQKRNLIVISPYKNSLIFLKNRDEERIYEGSMLNLKINGSPHFVIYGYLYTFKIGRFYFGMKPLFITTAEVEDEGDGTSSMDEGKNFGKDSK